MKKTISLLMALLMVLSLLPTAWAANVDDASSTAEVTQQEETIPQEDEQLPENEDIVPRTETPVIAPETMEAEGEDDGTAVAAGDVDTALKNAGFVAAPKPEAGNANVAGAAWFNIPGMSEGLVTVSYEGSTEYCRHMTLTIHKGTLEQWQSLYRSFQQANYNHSICASVFFNAPSNAVRGAWMCDNVNNYTSLEDFLNDDLAKHMSNYNGFGCNGTDFYLAGIDLSNGQAILSAEAGEESYRYLVAWDDDTNDNNGRLYKYDLLVTVKVEESFSHSWEEKSVMDRLFEQGYAAPVLGSDFILEMPDGLVEDVDYTIDYNRSTGVLNIQLLPGEMSHWQQAYQTLFEQYEANPDQYPDYFYTFMGFPNPSGNDNKVLIYPNDKKDYGLSRFINGQDDWSYSYYAPSGYNSGWSTWIGDAGKDNDNYAHVTFYECIPYSQYLVVSYANQYNQPISGKKFAVDITIEVPEAFSYEWSLTPLDQRLTANGFIAPTKNTGTVDNPVPGSFELVAPKGLVEGTDYTYDYDPETGELVITVNGNYPSHWKAAMLNSVILEPDDDIIFPVHFYPGENATQGVHSADNSQLENYLSDNYGTWENFGEGGFSMAGNGFAVATVSVSGSNSTIRSRAGSNEYLYAAVWADDNGTPISKYLLKITIKCEDFSRTVPTPTVQNVSADRIHVDTDHINSGSGAWNIITRDGQLAFMPTTGKTLTDLLKYNSTIANFTVQAPANGYELQSFFADYGENGNSYDNSPAEGNQYRFSAFAFEKDKVKGGTIRYTLRWHSDKEGTADIVEKLNVRIGDYALGKTSDSDIEKLTSLDMQNMYEYMTQEQQPITEPDGFDEKLATYDVNFDGEVSVYDLQRLYEAVALNRGF